MELIQAYLTLKKHPIMSKRVVFITCIDEDWGGSEELWFNTAISLAKSGVEITVIKKKINFNHQKFIELNKIGIRLISLEKKQSKSITIRIAKRLLNFSARVYNKLSPEFANINSRDNPLLPVLHFIKPDLVIIAQGDNFDGLNYAFDAWKQKIPYFIIAQKARETNWPYYLHREILRSTFKNARYCFFVSKHNQRLTEEQFGEKFTNAMLLQNPIKIRKQIDYPSNKDTYKLACIGRYYLLDKGQDILIRILAQEKWKIRPIHISFIGSGEDKLGLIELARLLGVANLSFNDYIYDIEELWKTHHALILPSRSEGMSLSVLEAMAVGRPVIVSNAGGNSEIVEDGFSGFIGEANTKDFELAMERAWNRKEDWETIGNNASTFIANDYLKREDQDLLKITSNLLNE
jgi:glycosyltransferase involved in cell wall biosynthesis